MGIQVKLISGGNCPQRANWSSLRALFPHVSDFSTRVSVLSASVLRDVNDRLQIGFEESIARLASKEKALENEPKLSLVTNVGLRYKFSNNYHVGLQIDTRGEAKLSQVFSLGLGAPGGTFVVETCRSAWLATYKEGLSAAYENRLLLGDIFPASWPFGRSWFEDTDLRFRFKATAAGDLSSSFETQVLNTPLYLALNFLYATSQIRNRGSVRISVQI